MRSEDEPKGRHTQKGLTDQSLIVPHNSPIWDELERPPIVNQHHRGVLFTADTSFTREEILRARADKIAQEDRDALTIVRRHFKTPLPNPTE